MLYFFDCKCIFRPSRNNDWDDQECRDDEEFLKFEEELWSNIYPEQASALVAEDKVDAEEISDYTDEVVPADDLEEGDMLSNLFGGCDNSEVMNMPMPELGKEKL